MSDFQEYCPQFNIEVVSTDNYTIITTEKIASDFIRNYHLELFSDKLTGVHLPKIGIQYQNKRYDLLPNFNLEDETLPYIYKETVCNVSKIIEGNYTKDVIVCIRDPYKRFISAIAEDYIKPILKNQFISEPYVGTLIRNSFEGSNKLVSEFTEHSHLFNNDNQFILENITRVELQLKELIKSVLTELMISNTPLDRAHNAYYHIPILILLQISKLNKFRIVDIGSDDLTKILDEYRETPKHMEATNTAKDLTKFIYDVFMSNSMIELKDRVIKSLYLEMLSYEVLKSKQ